MRKKILSLFVLIVLLFSTFNLFSCDYISANDPYNTINTISTTCTLSNVKVENRRRASITSGSGDTLIGSGVIIKEFVSTVGVETTYTYYLVTNNHVITKGSNYSQTIHIFDRYGNSFTGEVMFSSSRYDLAVVKFSTTIKQLRAISIIQTDETAGKKVFSIGSPSSQYNTITCGKLAGYVSPPNTSSATSNIDFDVIRHSAKIAGGSSGGMLINENFELIGINYAGDEESGIGYAIPASKLLEFLSINDFNL